MPHFSAREALLLFAAAAFVLARWWLRSKPTPLPDSGVDALLAGGSPLVIDLFDNG